MYHEHDQELLELGRTFLERLRREHANALAQAELLASTIANVEQTLRTLTNAPVQQQIPFEATVLRQGHAIAMPIVGEVDALTSMTLTPPQAGNGWARRLRGMSQHEAVVQIAEDAGGTVRTKDVADILLKAGLSEADPRNLYRYVLTILTTSDKFEKAGKGTYRLVAANDPQDEEDPLASLEEFRIE